MGAVTVLTRCLGLLLLAGAVTVYVFHTAGLSYVDIFYGTMRESRISFPVWLTCVLAIVGGIALTLDREPLSRPDMWQLVPATLAGFWTIAASRFVEVARFDPPQCVFANCWPSWYQLFAIATPLVLTFLAMAAMSFTALPWKQRILWPIGVFVTSAAVQRLTWGPLVLPILAGPPPG